MAEHCAATALHHLDQGLNELWFTIHQCGAVAQAVGDAIECLGLTPLTVDEVGQVQGLAGAASSLARQAAQQANALQHQVAGQLHTARPPT